MQPLLNRSHGALDRLLQRTLPNDCHAPAKRVKSLCIAFVATDISLKLLLPKRLIGPRCGCITATVVPMPEAAMYKYHRPVLRKHKIRRARQRLHVKSISKPSREKISTKYSLRPRVPSSDGRHHTTALQSGGDTHSLRSSPLDRLQNSHSASPARNAKHAHTQAIHETIFWSLACN